MFACYLFRLFIEVFDTIHSFDLCYNISCRVCTANTCILYLESSTQREAYNCSNEINSYPTILTPTGRELVKMMMDFHNIGHPALATLVALISVTYSLFK